MVERRTVDAVVGGSSPSPSVKMPTVKTVTGRVHEYDPDKELVLYRNRGVVEIQVADEYGNISKRHPYQNVSWYKKD